MENEKQQLEALQDIRKMMKDSSKFISLSGLSGVFAGVYALIGAWLGQKVLAKSNDILVNRYTEVVNDYGLMLDCIGICLGVFILSIATALLLTARKAKKYNRSLFDHSSKNVFWSMSIPLFTGGVFCMLLLYHGYIILVCPAMLLFYGLALVSSSKYTESDIRYLGYLEIALGLLAGFYTGKGLLFWALGFGVLHIIYGFILWFKYDRQS